MSHYIDEAFSPSHLLVEAMIRYISIMNLGISCLLFFTGEPSNLVEVFINAISNNQTSAQSNEDKIIESISFSSYGFTVSVCIIALCSTKIDWNRCLVLLLGIWDMVRFVFVVFCIYMSRYFPVKGDHNTTTLFCVYAVLLLVSIFIEYTYYTYDSSNEYGATNDYVVSPPPYSPIDTAPPPYNSLVVDDAPPPYSSVKSSSDLPATSIFIDVPNVPVGAALVPQSPPPPYELQGGLENPLFFPRSYEELQSQINASFSAQTNPPQQPIGSFDSWV